MSDLHFTSALQGQSSIVADISITEVENLGMIDVRGDLSDKSFAAAVKKVFGCGLPSKPRTSTTSKTVTCLWLSPDQWLITCPREQTNKILTDLHNACSNIHSLVVDVSDMRIAIRLKGNGAKEILMKGSSADLTGEDCIAGYVRRLSFAEQAGLAHVISNNPDCIDLYVFRSYADYVWKWIEATSKPASAVHLFGKQDLVQT